MYLAYVSGIFSDILSGILYGISSEIPCEARRGTLSSGARWRSGSEHCDLELAVDVPWGKEKEGEGTKEGRKGTREGGREEAGWLT